MIKEIFEIVFTGTLRGWWEFTSLKECGIDDKEIFEIVWIHFVGDGNFGIVSLSMSCNNQVSEWSC